MKRFGWILLFVILTLITFGVFPFIYCVYKGIRNRNWKYAIYPIVFISIFAFSGYGHSKKHTIGHLSKTTTPISISIKKSEKKMSESISKSRSLSESENESRIKKSESISESQSKSESISKSIAESQSKSESTSKSIAESNSQSIATSVSKSNEEASSYAAAYASATTTSSEQPTTTSQSQQSQQSQNIYGYTSDGNWSVAQSGYCFVSDSNIYYSRVRYPSNFKYITIDQAIASGARIAKRGNQYAQP
jgi:hypothetical protein